MKTRIHQLAIFALALTLLPFLGRQDLHATAATAARTTSQNTGAIVSIPMAASTTLYRGTMVCVNTSGYAVTAADTATLIIYGVAIETKTNSGSAGAASIKVARGAFKFVNSSTNAVDTADIGLAIYVEDNQTLCDTSSNAVYAGQCLKIDTDGGVWVDIRFPPATATVIADGVVTTAKLANDAVVTGKITDGTIVTADIATGGVATADILDGTILAEDIASAAVTPVKTNIVEARTATADGLTTGIISDTTTHVTVTSASANNIIVLPTPTPGRRVVIDVGANGFELRSSAPDTIAINGGTGAAAESAIAANSTVIAICVSATAWKAIFLDADSDVAKVEAAAP